MRAFEAVMIFAIFLAGIALGLRYGFESRGMQVYVGPQDMALCADYVPEDRAAVQAGVWTNDIDGESAP